MTENDMLEYFLNKEYITSSDVNLLSLINSKPNLALLQSKDRFDWSTMEGSAEHIVGEYNLNYHHIKRLEPTLDLYLIDEDRLKDAGESYKIETHLHDKGHERRRDSSPNLKYLELALRLSNKDTKNFVRLSKYSISETERYLEYVSMSDFTSSIQLVKTIVCTLRYRNPQKKREITLVYRTAISSNRIAGQRLYIKEGNSLKMLDSAANSDILAMMGAVDYWHDNFLKENNSSTHKLSSGKEPDYMSIYG